MQFITPNRLIKFYDSLNSDKYTSFYQLSSEIEKELRYIAYDSENQEAIRNAALIEYGVLQFQSTVDTFNNYDKKTLPFNAIDNNYIEYLENRIKQTTNPFVLARYYHILWLAEKHNNYGIEAIKNYFISKDIIIRQKEINKYWTFDLLECLKRSFIIKCKIKSKANVYNIEQEIITLISIFLEDEWGLNLCTRLLDIINVSHKYFKDVLSYDLINKVNQYAFKLINKNEPFNAIRLLKVIIKISEKMNYNTTNIYENLAIANEARIYDLNKSAGSISFCLEAMNIYSKLKNGKKVEELRKTYQEISKKMVFGIVKTEININQEINEIKSQIEKCKNLSIDSIIQFLVYDKMFLPPKNLIEKTATNEKEGFLSSLLGGNYNIFDQYGNLIRTYSTDEEKKWFKIMRTYTWWMQIEIIKINIAFTELVKTGKFNFDELYNYLMNDTWFSHVFKLSNHNGEEISYSYSNIIHNLLAEYFRIFNKYLLSNEIKRTDFIFFIDSMTLKIEGLIRDLFTLKNYSIIIQNHNDKTVQRKDLNALLYDEHIKEFLDEDELLFFKYLFIDQGGLNLRNRIAHSLLLEQEYDIGKVNLLFLALLILSKFYFQKDDKSTI